jgi:hypothetical protein
LKPAKWFGDYVYIVGPQRVPSKAGTAVFIVYVHYVTSWFTTPIGEENDHLIATKVLVVSEKDATATALLLNDWAISMTDVLGALSYQQALERATLMLAQVEAALVGKLLFGDYTTKASAAPVEPTVSPDGSPLPPGHGPDWTREPASPRGNGFTAMIPKAGSGDGMVVALVRGMASTTVTGTTIPGTLGTTSGRIYTRMEAVRYD